jgi:NADPH:quinone reductase-like Zn-dependent oxidoreductase/ubiquinone/menaquinone biosynthesis C-methylase UbiE
MSLVAEDFEYIVVSDDSDATRSDREPRNLTAHMVWKPDLDVLTKEEAKTYCHDNRDPRDDPLEFLQNWEIVCLALASCALSGIRDGHRIAPEHGNYILWLSKTIASFKCTKPPMTVELLESCIEQPAILEALCSKVEKQKSGELYIKVGKALPEILIGEINPLEVMFGDEQLMTDYYDEMLQESRPLKSIQAYFDALVHKRPDMKFIEIGAGTGGSTSIILEVLNDWAGPRYSEYVFTDIGPFFLERARTRFSNRSNMQFRTLDIEADPIEQGFPEHRFDVVIADMVLHATADLSQTMQHVRKLLKPGGKLILKEVTEDKICAGFIFGLLPGWWRSVEGSRKQVLTPCVSEEEWDSLLKSHHFSGNDLSMWDFSSRDVHIWGYLISTATLADLNDYARLPAPLIVARENSERQVDVAEHIVLSLGYSKDEVKILTIEKVTHDSDLANKDLIVIYECDEPALVAPTPEFFTAFQNVLLCARSILWVSQSGYIISPEYYIIAGLMRVLRVENPATKLLILGLGTRDPVRMADYVSTIFNVTQDAIKRRMDIEPEFMERADRLHINRIVLSKRINEHIFRRTARPVIHQPVGDSDIRLRIRALGLLDTLEFSEEYLTESKLAANEVVVRVHSIGVNFKDCLTLLGRIDTDLLGSECAGIVVRVGDQCRNIFAGTRVVVCVFDAYRSLVRTTVDRVTPIPDWMSFPMAASIPTAFCTAHFSLLRVARLQKDEKVLTHAAAGGTGQAAIQVAQSVDAEVFTTVGSLAKKKLLMDLYGIPESHIFYSRDTSFAKSILDATDGKGPDVILNSLSGKQLQASWEVIADFGRFVEIGRSDIDSRKTLPMFPFRKNSSFTGVDLTMVMSGTSGSKTQNLGTVLSREVMDQVEAGNYKPVQPLHEYEVEDIEQAFRIIQSGKSSGKIVVNVSPHSIVPVSFHQRDTDI